MKIPLAQWGANNYNPCPSIRTLRAWAASGQIHPAPELVGRNLMVDEFAQRIPLPQLPADGTNMSTRAISILKSI
jgi:hypothetical protein